MMYDTDFKNRFIDLRKKVIEKSFSGLNEMQRKAVFKADGPVLVLAGAGSGKTTVLVNRIANVIRFGNGYNSDIVPAFACQDDIDFLNEYLLQISTNEESDEKARRLCAINPAAPWNIIAITFTNKAAGELKERLCKILGDDNGQDVWASTFHSACVRILRRDIERLGFERSFTIYDSDDSLRVIKDVMKSHNVDDKRFAPKMVQGQISKTKNLLLKPNEFIAKFAAEDFRLKVIGEIYTEYQKLLKNANALDFDDIIMFTVELLNNNKDVLDYYQNKFRYVLVDEYQDTNHSQYVLVSLLAGGYNNICVVGDDDQSIYRFRGATIENILGFENKYPDAYIIRLEQNYRSTKNILDAANKVIEKNTERKEKTMWTNNGSGNKVTVYRAPDDQSECLFIANTILKGVEKNSKKFSDYAILYRMNSQSALLERILSKMGIPHRIIGGLRFYDRKEIKDILAYLNVLANPNDSHRLKRIINEPKRGVGAATIELLEAISSSLQKSMLEVCSLSHQIEPLYRSSQKLCAFYDMMEALSEKQDTMPLNEYVELVIRQTGYLASLEAQDDVESRGRIENLMELISNALSYEKNTEGASLQGFLEEVALLSDIDNHDPTADSVSLMTVHSAKGLEFPVVFIYGMEESIFPSMMSMNDPSDIEEERRLCYVAITRAREEVFITHADERILFGKTVYNKLSRFAQDIPKELLTQNEDKKTDAKAKKNYPKINAGKMMQSSMFAQPADNKKITQIFNVGDMVEHGVFGRGMVISSKITGNDLLLEVAFDKVGTKKLMANFAKLIKL